MTASSANTANIANAATTQPLAMRILVRPFAYRHPRAWGTTALIAGVWVVVLGAILCTAGLWWGAAVIAAGALELWVAYRLLRVAQA